jgi:hypothetical protein
MFVNPANSEDWLEYQNKKEYAKFKLVENTEQSVVLFDENRKISVKLTDTGMSIRQDFKNEDFFSNFTSGHWTKKLDKEQQQKN